MKLVSKHKKLLFFLALLAGIGVITLFYFWNPANNIIFPKCLFYSATNLYCPGCGSQRAIHQILHGQIMAGLKYNYLIGFLVLVLGYQLYVYISQEQFNKNTKNILHKPMATKFILILVIFFWILRNIPFYPFNTLAP
ncbi:DUF2752 domain-containing protein [Xanthomarina sp. F2636L]|uniref:DUF2752 domain-containing protein n=1 Tax=Xanthomarina sp. F2636L TaxID=2996018 RepID=UPI00225E67B0|nr:DUF2752 domain-containing protein [Xanthomarina sp. F2636L]MCX7550423.1 DUF2752 domain-containing protein [Xanthomarina sp. F2636L]